MTQSLRRQAVRIVIGTFLLAAIYGAMLVWLPYHREQRVAEKIRSVGGKVSGIYYIGPSQIPNSIAIRLKFLYRIVTVDFADGPDPTEALSSLKDLPYLHDLHLDRTQITDADLVEFETLSSLTELHLSGTKTTEHGRAMLQKKLPDCWITPEH